MEQELREVEDEQEFLLFGAGFGNSLIECSIASDGGKECVKGRAEGRCLLGVWGLAIVQKLMIEIPIALEEVSEQLLVKVDKRRQLFVMSAIMNPTKIL